MLNKKEMQLIIILTIFTFILGTSEYVIVGLLKDISKSFDVTIAVAGTLVSAFAFSFAIGTPIAMVLAKHFSKSSALIGASTMIAILSISVVFAPNFEMLYVIRMLTAIFSGLAVSLALIMGADGVRKAKRGISIAFVLGGFTIANVFGVPIGTFIAQLFHWKLTFILIGIVGFICTICMYIIIPKKLPKVESSLKAQIQLIFTLEIFLAFMIPVLAVAAIFGFYTYIVPYMTDILGIRDKYISGILVLYGVMTIISNIIGAKMASGFYVKNIRNMIFVHVLLFICLALTKQMTLLGLLTILLIGGTSFSINAAVQLYVVQMTERLLPEARDFAASLYPIGANLGIALGSALSAYIIDAFSLAVIPWMAVLLAVMACALTVYSMQYNTKRGHASILTVSE